MTLSATYATRSSATLDCGLEGLSGMFQRLLRPGEARARRAHSVGPAVGGDRRGPRGLVVGEPDATAATTPPLGHLLSGPPSSDTEDAPDDLLSLIHI